MQTLEDKIRNIRLLNDSFHLYKYLKNTICRVNTCLHQVDKNYQKQKQNRKPIMFTVFLVNTRMSPEIQILYPYR